MFHLLVFVQLKEIHVFQWIIIFFFLSDVFITEPLFLYLSTSIGFFPFISKPLILLILLFQIQAMSVISQFLPQVRDKTHSLAGELYQAVIPLANSQWCQISPRRLVRQKISSRLFRMRQLKKGLYISPN